LDVIRGLAMQGMTMDEIADALGIHRDTLFKKKRELADFSDALKKGVAEGKIVATSQLFHRVKKGEAWAVIFFLKARCGWRETGDPARVNVNIGTLQAKTADAEQREQELEEQRKLISLLTTDERRTYLELMERAARRQREGMPAIDMRPLTVEEIEAEAAELEAEGQDQ
jgi:hypothetical protein